MVFAQTRWSRQGLRTSKAVARPVRWTSFTNALPALPSSSANDEVASTM